MAYGVPTSFGANQLAFVNRGCWPLLAKLRLSKDTSIARRGRHRFATDYPTCRHEIVKPLGRGSDRSGIGVGVITRRARREETTKRQRIGRRDPRAIAIPRASFAGSVAHPLVERIEPAGMTMRTSHHKGSPYRCSADAIQYSARPKTPSCIIPSQYRVTLLGDVVQC